VCVCVCPRSPVPEVIVLSSPAPECIRKSINLLELLHRHAADAAEELVVRQPGRDKRTHQNRRGRKRGKTSAAHGPHGGPITDSHVGVLVEFDRKVPRHVGAAVVVAVVLHEVVHVVEDQAVPVQVLHGLLVAHVEQHGAVEWLRAPL